jgi:ferredoxin-NADP reductase
MTTYQVALVKREEVAEGTMAFHFKKPADFSFKPGQAIDVILEGRTAADAQHTRHSFSIVSAPFQDELVIATRMRDSMFKRTLKSLSIGAAVEIDGPFGALTLHADGSRPAVFVAGGIGITPFMSMLRQAVHDGLPHQILMLYANRRPEDAAFLVELQGIERATPKFRLAGVMSKMRQSSMPWNGATGLVDGELIKTTVGNPALPVYYLVGPPAMVEAMYQELNQIGVGDNDIRSEEFYGY